MNHKTTAPIILAMTGASGSPYGLRLLECLIKAKQNIYFLMSDSAREVLAIEENKILPAEPAELQDFLSAQYQAVPGQLKVFGKQEWTAPVASGSSKARAMVICPCSSGCVSAVTQGSSNNLIERAADVMLKEQRKLILVHRETPLSVIHLENLLKLAKMGVTILPASPGFYNRPTQVQELIDFVVARVLDHLGIEQQLVPCWGEQ